MDFNLTFHMPPLLSLQTQFSSAQAPPQPALEGVADPNNNDDEAGEARGGAGGRPKGEKYSLRPRSGQKRVTCEPPDRLVAAAVAAAAGGRRKQKPPPLSKYRRKTANARERDRMREINAAFESLRRAVPHSPAESSCQAGEKLTKITTLRLAMKYIAALSQALQQDAEPAPADLADLLSDCGGDAPDLDSLLLESDDDSLCLRSDLSDASSFTPPDFDGEHPADCRASLTTPVFGDPADLDQLFS